MTLRKVDKFHPSFVKMNITAIATTRERTKETNTPENAPKADPLRNSIPVPPTPGMGNQGEGSIHATTQALKGKESRNAELSSGEPDLAILECSIFHEVQAPTGYGTARRTP